MTVDELYERCQDEIFNIEEAIDYLKQVRDMKDTVDYLNERKYELETESETHEEELSRIAQEERDELNREYERGLL